MFNGNNNGVKLPPNTVAEIFHPDDLKYLKGSNGRGAAVEANVQQLFADNPINTFRVNGLPTEINTNFSKDTIIILGGNSGDGCVRARRNEYLANGYTNVIIDPNLTDYEGD